MITQQHSESPDSTRSNSDPVFKSGFPD